jgi:hypothetical protein
MIERSLVDLFPMNDAVVDVHHACASRQARGGGGGGTALSSLSTASPRR